MAFDATPVQKLRNDGINVRRLFNYRGYEVELTGELIFVDFSVEKVIYTPRTDFYQI